MISPLPFGVHVTQHQLLFALRDWVSFPDEALLFGRRAERRVIVCEAAGSVSDTPDWGVTFRESLAVLRLVPVLLLHVSEVGIEAYPARIRLSMPVQRVGVSVQPEAIGDLAKLAWKQVLFVSLVCRAPPALHCQEAQEGRTEQSEHRDGRGPVVGSSSK